MKSRIEWLCDGDRNAKFFHASVLKRRERNHIVRIKDSVGNWLCDPKDIEDHINAHFQFFFTISLISSYGIWDQIAGFIWDPTICDASSSVPTAIEI